MTFVPEQQGPRRVLNPSARMIFFWALLIAIASVFWHRFGSGLPRKYVPLVEVVIAVLTVGILAVANTVWTRSKHRQSAPCGSADRPIG
jgi:hypothetical protein